MLIERSTLDALEKTINSLYQKEFDIYTQYKLLQILKIVKDEKQILTDQIASLMEQFGERDEKGDIILVEKGFKIIPEKAQLCEEKYLELLKMKVQFPEIFFSLDELKGLHLTLEQLNLLEPFIKI